MQDRFARQIAYLDRHPSVGLLGSACLVFDQNGERGVWSAPTSPLAVRWQSLLANPFIHPTVTIRREVLAGANLNYDPRLSAAQDYDLWTRLLRHTEGANLAAPLIRYRLHPGQTTTRRREEQLLIHDRIAVRTIAAELPGAYVHESDVGYLRALFHGSGDLPPDPVATVTLYLDLLDAFLGRRASTDTQRSTLKRVEARRVLGALSRTGNMARGSKLMVRLLRLDPTLPLRAIGAAAARTRVRPAR
jgi:hypothetical protein